MRRNFWKTYPRLWWKITYARPVWKPKSLPLSFWPQRSVYMWPRDSIRNKKLCEYHEINYCVLTHFLEQAHIVLFSNCSNTLMPKREPARQLSLEISNAQFLWCWSIISGEFMIHVRLTRRPGKAASSTDFFKIYVQARWRLIIMKPTQLHGKSPQLWSNWSRSIAR